MVLIALSNPIWLMWPEGLMVLLAALYFIGIRGFVLDGASSPTSLRLTAFTGLLATASLLSLGARINLFTVIAIPAIPAPFAFGVLIFRPNRVLRWAGIRIYLSVCVAASAVCWTFQIVWLSTG